MKTRILSAIIIVGGLLPYTNGLLACPRPTAILYVSPDCHQTFVGNQLTLDGSHSIAGSGNIISYRWNFDYPNSTNWVQSSSIITHSYQVPGRYTIALWVTNSSMLDSLITEQCKFTVDVNGVIYVNEQSPAGDNGDGFGWATAFNNLQSALDDANSGVQIWVAQGTYAPSKQTNISDSRTATFQLADGVRIYGGFNGTETSLYQRDWQAYPTVLSGDLAGNDADGNTTENAYHVVTGSGTDATAVLDGFAITSGKANGADSNYRGGGMYNIAGSPTITNCGFSHNYVAKEGGGVYNSGGEPNFTNCIFGYNSALDGGSGAFNNGGVPNFTNCTFINEDFGAGVYNSGGNETFTGCVFSDHTAEVALYNTDGASPLIKNCAFINNSQGAISYDSGVAIDSAQITNCIFAGNVNSSSHGGAISLYGNCNAAITNCVFNNNSSDYDGGAIYNTGGEPNFYNCIFWGDSASHGGEIYNAYGTIKISNCDIEGGIGGAKISNYDTIIDDGNNINADPQFGDVCNPAGLDSIFFTDDDGLQIGPGSLCIDTCPASGAPDKDILGQTRISIPYIGLEPNIVDMGAYEVQRPVWHVKQGNTVLNNGIGWNNAFNYLQDALAAARTYGGDIWVAAGTYKPDENSVYPAPNGTGYRDANFALINGVGIYGGFDGNETMCGRRNPTRNETILSGNIYETGDSNSYQVVTAIDVNETAILSGFTISDGNAGLPANFGGGMYDYNASPTIMDCNFKNNKARLYGGAIYNDSNSSPVITNCLFINNEANMSISSSGGAIYNNSSSPTISNCNFINNIAKRYGGAIFNLLQSNPTLLNCAFSGNKTTNTSSPAGGGAVFNSHYSSPLMTNCVFAVNTAYNGGGIHNINNSSSTLVNCTFSGNSAINDGGGMYNNGGECNSIVTNCIFWDNNAASDGNEIYNSSGNPAFKHCDIKGCIVNGSWNSDLGTNGGGNIDVDPNFVDTNNPAGPDGIFGTSDDGLQLRIFDPNLTSCVDAADGNTAPAADIRGQGRIDIEFVNNTGSGEPNYADIGAYEYDDIPGYIISFETDEGYVNYSDPILHNSVDGVDGWKVEEGSDGIERVTYVDPNSTSHLYQYDRLSGNSKISHETTQPSDKSIIRISCIPSPGSYINVLSGSVTIASIKFGEGDDINTYVWDKGVYKKASTAPDYNQVATQCRRFLGHTDTTPPYSYENTWIEFIIKFNWINHSYDVSWENYAVSNSPVIYSGAGFYSGCSSYAKVEFITGNNNSKFFNLNRMSFSDEVLDGGIIGTDQDIWLIAPQANLKDPLKGRCAIVGPMWYDKLGKYIISACPSDLDPNDANSWMQVCSGRTVSKYATTLGYWNIAAFYNGDYFLRVEVYDDIGCLVADANITTERTFNEGRTHTCKATYPIIGRFKPQTYSYQELPDFKINWPGSFPFEFQRMYNSGQSSRLYPLFFGWTHNHNIRLIEDASFDWIKDTSGKPVRDNKGLGVGRLWLCLPSGGGLFIGRVDDTNTNNVVYEPTDKTNQRIVRTVNYIDNPATTSDVNVTYVYYAPDGRKMTFNKAFTVGYPVPANEGLIDWMAVTGIDKQEDRFGNALEYTWEDNETFLQQISNNRTPAKLVLTNEFNYWGLYLCSEIRSYDGDVANVDEVSFGTYVDYKVSGSYSVNRGDMDPPYRVMSACGYSYVGHQYMMTKMILQDGRGSIPAVPVIKVDYNDGALIKRTQGTYNNHGYGDGWAWPKQYSYEYDTQNNLTTTLDINLGDGLSMPALRREIIATSPSGALLSQKIRTFPVLVNGEEFKPYDYHYYYREYGPYGFYYCWALNNIDVFSSYVGGGGATDVNYYYQDSRFPLKPTKIITYFDDDGDGSYDRPSQKTTLAYDSRGNVVEQKVYVDDVNYVLTTFAYHNNYDFQTRKTTWQVYRHDGDSEDASTKVEQQWLYGDVNGTLMEGGNGGDYLVVQRTLLDNTTNPEEWADVCCAYYSGGQIKQKTDPEGGVSYYEYDVNGFVSKEWQGAIFVGSSPVGNPQKRYYYDGLGHKVLDADYLGKVQMGVWDYAERLIQSREYNDIYAVSRSNFEPGFYDAEVLIDNVSSEDPEYMVDWWLNRTVYSYDTWISDRPGSTTLPTGGTVSVGYLHNGKELYEWRRSFYCSQPGHLIFEDIDFGLFPEDGRRHGEFRYDVYTGETGDIDNVYDSMYRVRHKYSQFDDPQPDWHEYTFAHKYIKHEEYQYDASGNKISEAVRKVERKQDYEGGPVWFEATLEKQNSYEYDILNRLTKEIVDSNTAVGMKLTTKYGYDAVGNRIYVIDPNGNVILTDYDNANRKLCDYFAATPVYYPGTDKVNVDATTTTARKEVTYYKNDKVKDVNSYDYGGGLLARSEYAYDSRGRIKEVNEFITASQIATTKYDYDDTGFVRDGDPCGYKYQIKITDANGKNTWISMHPLGKPQKIVYPSGDYEEYLYYNLPLSETDLYPVPRPNPNGLLGYKAVWDASGDKKYIRYEYDDYGKVKKITYPDGGYLTYDYTIRTNGNYGVPRQIKDYRDVNNRPGSDVNDYGIYTFNYIYLTGKLKSYTDYEGYEVNYMYSFAYDQPTNIEVNAPNGGGVIYEVNYVYDMAGRLKDVCEPLLGDNCLIAGFGYDKNGNRAYLDYFRDGTRTSNVTSVGYMYNRDNMLTGFSTSGGSVFGFNATQPGDIDGLGRLKSGYEGITKSDTGQTTLIHNFTYQYDMRSQLTNAYMTNVLSYYDWVLDTYSYDKAGNVQNHNCLTYPQTQQSLRTSYTFDGDLMASACPTSGNGENFALSWNDNGNLTKKDDTEDTNLVYNWDNKLRQATKGTEGISIKYDPMGNRVWKQSTVSEQTTTRKFVVDIAGGLPTILLEIEPNDSSLKKSYIYANGEILAQHDGNNAAARYFYLHDRLGSVRQIINTNGSVVKYYTFGPFGDTREIGGTLLNSFMFTGQFYDSEIGQYYLRARQYDPQLMRFTGRDSIKGKYTEPLTLHRYLYCDNDSINRIDPEGRWAAALVAPTVAGYATEAIGIAVLAYAVTYDKEAAFALGIEIEKSIGAVMFLVGVGINYGDALVHAVKQNIRDDFDRLKQIGKEFDKTLDEVRDAIHKAKQKMPYKGIPYLDDDEIRDILESGD